MLMVSSMVRINLYPLEAATNASPVPVFPRQPSSKNMLQNMFKLLEIYKKKA